MEYRVCGDCKGTGKGYRKTEACSSCNGEGRFPEPDYQKILSMIVTSRGGKERIKSSPNSISSRINDITACRAYYVWRLARFHGGIDVTMPALAGILSWADPFKSELDDFACEVARRYFGTDLAAAARWAPLLGLRGGDLQKIKGLPPTAYSNGPVTMDHKPEEEWPELYS
jgi:hypothetical protein